MIDRIKHHGTSVIIELSKDKEHGDVPTITIDDTIDSSSHKVITLGHGAAGTCVVADVDGLYALTQVLNGHLVGGNLPYNYGQKLCWYRGINDEINVVVLVPRSHYSLVAIESDMFGDNYFATHWVPNNHLHKPKTAPPSNVDVVHHITESLDLTSDPNYTTIGTDEYNIIRHTPSGTKYRVLVERVR